MHVDVTRARHSHRKLKLMFSPFGRSVPSLKINLISCCLRLMLLPAHCFKPQTRMSTREWEAELKCSATGNPRDRFRILRRCSLKRSRSRLPVSPVYSISERRRGISGVYKDITEVSLAPIWYQRGFGENPACLGSEDKMLKLSSKIRLVPTLNGWKH